MGEALVEAAAVARGRAVGAGRGGGRATGALEERATCMAAAFARLCSRWLCAAITRATTSRSLGSGARPSAFASERGMLTMGGRRLMGG